MSEIEDALGSGLQTPLIMLLLALAVTALLAVIVRFIVMGLGKRLPMIKTAYSQIKVRLFVFIAVALSWVSLAVTWLSEEEWWSAAAHVFMIALLIAFGWLLIGVVTGLFKHSIDRLTGEGVYERRKRTQLLLLRRLSVATIVVFVVAAVLFSFPPVRTIGVSLFASAGILSVVAGLAAQSTLGNLIAGLQLSFSDALRVGDTVVVEGEYGTVGEITLSYVVINIWDDRRLILPCTYFTSQPFEQWTRHSGNIMSTVHMDCDWRVPVDKLRAKFDELVAASPEYDGRYSNFGVTDATGGLIRVRMVVSCNNVDDIWTFTRRLHEDMIAWVQKEHPEALPVTRVEMN